MQVKSEAGIDPTDGQAKTVAQLLSAHPDIQDVKFNFVEQMGGGAGPGSFYFDNVRLNGVPEPSVATLLLLGGSLILAVRLDRAQPRLAASINARTLA